MEMDLKQYSLRSLRDLNKKETVRNTPDRSYYSGLFDPLGLCKAVACSAGSEDRQHAAALSHAEHIHTGIV